MKRILMTLVTLLALAACATNPASKGSDFVLMSENDELAIGQQMAAQVAKQLPLLSSDDPLVKYVDKVGQRIAATSDRPELFYRFHVVDDGTINAFALPGGYIYVHRGLLAHFNSEAELAAVLGHEVGHVTARHAVQRYTQAQAYNIGMTAAAILVGIPQGVDQLTNLLATAMIMGYGREQELESDELSLRYLTAAGYDAHATIELLKTLERLDGISMKEKADASGKKPEANYHGAFSSHPETKKRIEEAIDKAAKLQKDGMNRVGKEAMLAALDGYPLKDSSKDGAVVGRRFLHPSLGFRLEFPDHWVIKNSPLLLTARLRQEEAYFTFGMKNLQKRRSAEEVLKSLFPARHIGVVTTGNHNGFPFARSMVMTSAPHVSEAAIDANVFLDGPRAFIILLYSPRKEAGKYQSQFDRIRDSFRRYDIAIDGDVPKIHNHIWKRGDSWEKLARSGNYVLGRFTADRLAALNGMDLKDVPAPGALVKDVR